MLLQSLKEQWIAAGCDDFLAKPIRSDVLADAILNSLAKQTN